jgi:hypothetical protein
MSTCRLFAPMLLAAQFAISAEAPPAAGEGKPWSETFAMTLQGKDRTYVVHEGNSFLMAAAEDLATPSFLNGKDVMFNAKLGRIEGTHVRFYNIPKVDADGPAELWRTRVDGDNLFVFGHMTFNGTALHLQISAAANAPSDSQLIAERLSGVATDDLNARLGVAAWVREQGNLQGNREFWLVSADTIISQVVDDATVQAESKKDVSLVIQAMAWCQDLLHDIPRAARLGSAAWIRTVGGTGPEDVAKRMRRWDLEFYNGQWRPRGEALNLEFTDRFNAIGWRDAENFYKLGRWSDANAEVLPRARELSYRCYQAGFRANPNHNGIRRELGMELVADNGSGEALQGDFKDGNTSVVVITPPGWSRAKPMDRDDSDVNWIDPSSDTAVISAKVLRVEDEGQTFKTLWDAQVASVQAKPGYSNLGDEKLTFSHGEAKRLRYSYHEGRYVRLAELLFAYNKAAKVGVRFEASAAENEAESVHKQLQTLFSKLDIPNTPTPVDHAAPAPGTPKAGAPQAAPAPGAQGAPKSQPKTPAGAPTTGPAAVPLGRSATNPD